MESVQAYPKILKFLLVSDTHMNTDQIQKLLDYYDIVDDEEKKSKFDYILHAGDFDNLTCV